MTYGHWFFFTGVLFADQQKEEVILGLVLLSPMSPGEGNGNPLRYFCLESPMDRGAGQAAVHGIAESDTTVQPTFTFMSRGCLSLC